MLQYKITETCSCGSVFEMQAGQRGEMAYFVETWRKQHHHAGGKADPPPAAEPDPQPDPGSVTTTSASPRSDGEPPLFGFAPRCPL
jgi:hypothetical protein